MIAEATGLPSAMESSRKFLPRKHLGPPENVFPTALSRRIRCDSGSRATSNYLQQHLAFFAAFFLVAFLVAFLAAFFATFFAGAFLATFLAAFFLATVTPPSRVSQARCLTDPTVEKYSASNSLV